MMNRINISSYKSKLFSNQQNLFLSNIISQRMENDYETPMKNLNGMGDGASTIVHGLTETRGMAESKLWHQQGQQCSSRNEQEKRLDQIQKQISEIGKQLESLHYQMQKQSDKYSQKFLNMERVRNQLRKRLIDLDYEHKSIFAQRMQQSRRLEQEQKQKIRAQFQQKQKIRSQERQQRQRRRKQQLDRYEQQYRQKIRATMSNRRGELPQKVSQIPGQQNKEEGSEANGQGRAEDQETPKVGQDQLSRSRRRVRIAEIEAELAESRLERSRNSVLNSQLDYLRISYSDPYFTYRPYVLPSYHYPYSPYPTYSSRWWYY